MSREPFEAFLQNRGGGRGSPMGTPGRGRGMPRRRGRGRGGSTAPQDYTNVGGPVNYDIINQERYKKSDNVYIPSPYSQNTPKPRISSAIHGTPSPASGSGAATPTTGLGFQGSSRGSSLPSRGGRDGFVASRFDNQAGASSPSPYAGIGEATKGRGGAALKKIMFGRGRGGFSGRDVVDWSSRGAPVFVKGKTAFETEDDQPDAIPTPMAVTTEEDDVDGSGDSEEADGVAMDTVEDILLVEQVESMSISPDAEPRAMSPLLPSLGNSRMVICQEALVLEGSSVVAAQVVEMEIMMEKDVEELEAEDQDRYSPSLPQESGISEEPPQSAGQIKVEANTIMAVDDATPAATSTGFIEDLTGAVDGVPDEPVLFDRSVTNVLGDTGSEEEEEEIVFVPRGSAPTNIDDPVFYEKPSSSRYDIASSNVVTRSVNGMKPITVVSLPSNGRKQDKKSKKAQKKAGRQAKREGRMRKTEGQPRIGDSDVDWGSDGPPGLENDDAQEGERGHREALRDHHRALMAEKEREAGTALQHAIDITDEETGESQAEEIDLDALKRFAKGVNGQHVMIHDTELERQIQQEDEEDEEAWEDESDSEAPKAGLGHKVAFVRGRARDAIEVSSDTQEDAIDMTHGFAEDDLQSGSKESDSSDMEADGGKDAWRHVADASQSEDSDDDSDEDIHAMFGESKRGKLTWADAADDMIEEMSRVIEENADMLRGGKGNRAERKKLFKSIQNGDFGDDWSAGPAPKGKKAKKAGIPDELQAQWEKDRAKKAEFKRQRQMERLEAEFDLFPGARKKEKQNGKGKGRANKWEPQGWAEGSEEDDIPRSGGRKGKKGFNPVVDLWDLNKQIRSFLKDEGKTTMSMAPMEKHSRRKVHELANCYSLKSQSKGQGNSRFPILIKTSRSIIQLADLRQVERILNSAPSYEFRQPKSKQSGTSGRVGGAGKAGFSSEVRHRDGDVVGGQASAIGKDNIGHRLLSMMGWSEGGKIGLSEGGLEIPISAIVKNSKLGLGA